MAEPLKNQYGPHIPKEIARMIKQVHPAFSDLQFMSEALTGYDKLELLARGWHMAHLLAKHLPQTYPEALGILMSSLGEKLSGTESFGMTPFLYMPHIFYVAHYGLKHPEISLQAQYELTQRFTAEFSIRPYLIHHRDLTLKTLRSWIKDPSPHVRRLISEGTRPRLPWAMRLPEFQKNPAPVLALLEQLKNDPDLYVRRSVANNLNDIGKDNPDILIQVVRAWQKNADENRQWILRHALRSLVKKGHPQALHVLGFKTSENVRIQNKSVQKERHNKKEYVTLSFDVLNPHNKTIRVLIDFQIHYVKANGKSAPKVFKLTSTELKPKEKLTFSKRVSLADMTTRKHYPGRHRVDILANGNIIPLGAFLLT